ncbi:MAG: right-handed parallel beta-helix repeat-containing protein [Flavobacteriales bacterium]|nr:right-handed parallel beta-helix repeat-containing protein [Flavobacteriales bacterium]
MTGNDGNSGLSAAQAWATIQHAADIALAGDSVIVHAGSHAGFAAMDHSGTASAPIVFMAGSEDVLIDSPCTYNDLDGINVENVDWVVIEGFTVNDMPRSGIRTALTDHVTIRYNICANNSKWGILTGFAEHVIIEHNTCSGSQDEHGIYFSNSADDPIIRHNHCFDNNANGIHMNGDASLGGDGIISNAQVYGNIIHGNGTAGGSGINCDGVVNSVIYNNLLYDNHASGISLYRIDGGAPSTGNKVYNNTVVNANDARWCMNIAEGCTGNRLLNNIFINQHPFRGAIVVAADALDGSTSDYNLVMSRLSPDGDATILDLAAWQELGYDAHSIVAAPLSTLFVDIPAADYHASSANSQQVDSGTDAVLPEVPNDLALEARPAGAGFDIGCYERGLNTGFGHPQATTDLPTPYFLNDALILPAFAPGGRVRVIDAQGRLIVQAVASGPLLSLPALTSRAYVVQMTQADGGHPSAWRIIR